MSPAGLLVVAISLATALDGGTGKVDPLGFEIHVNPNQVHLGEPFVYQFVVTHLLSQRFELKTPTDLGAFEVLEVQRRRVDGKDRATTTFDVKMSAFELGKQQLPDPHFEVFDETGTQQFTAPGSGIEVISSLPKDVDSKGEGLNDIRGPEDVPVRSYRLLYGLAALLAAAALGYGIYRFVKRPRRVVDAARPSLPLDARTLQSLDALRTEDLPGLGRTREFHFRLSEIIRGYLGERYGFEALECTSGELLEALRKRSTPGLPFEGLQKLVYSSDLIKFAKVEASPFECKDALDFAYQLVPLTFNPSAPAPIADHALGPRIS